MIENNYSQNEDSQEEELFELESEIPNQREELSPRRKLAVLGLAFFSLVIVVLWVAQFSRSLDTNPGLRSQAKELGDNAVCSGSDCFADLDAISLTIDTDNDGLTDVDEQNIYLSSAYIADTDSDGVNDGDEVKAGTDPNCPTGKDCSATTDFTGTTTMDIGKVIDAEPITTTDANISGTQPVQGAVDVAELRALLFRSGMSQEILDTISDEEILSAYSDTAKNLGSNISN